MILIPKNRGLIQQASLALAERAPAPGVLMHVRGEDVGSLASDAARAGRSVFAMTGDDLLDEWLASGNELDARLVRSRRLWSDPNTLYGAPALCSIAAVPNVFSRERVRVAICSRYALAAERYLASVEARGVTFERRYVQGALETVVASGLADCAIDVVVTGRSIRDAGLGVVDVISRSNLAILETRR